ncbi:MAG: hypothetical protein KTR21_15495, partial [Rhodobacteraceae bacterium]|nr:hypothetical protein [Paracoccaceae bacterium]
IAALEARGVEAPILRWNADPAHLFLACDAVVLRQTWDYKHDPAGFAAWACGLERAGARLLNPAAMAIWNNDKRTLSEVGAAGFAIPVTVNLGAEPVEAAAERLAADRYVLKPAFGGGGRAVRAASRADLAETLAEAQNEALGLPFMLQEFLPEIADGEYSLSFVGGVCALTRLKRPHPGEFRVNAKFSPKQETIDPPEVIVSTAAAIVDRFASGALYARVDGVKRGDDFICTELELCDPDLSLHTAPGAADLLAEETIRRVEATRAAV